MSTNPLYAEYLEFSKPVDEVHSALDTHPGHDLVVDEYAEGGGILQICLDEACGMERKVFQASDGQVIVGGWSIP